MGPRQLYLSDLLALAIAYQGRSVCVVSKDLLFPVCRTWDNSILQAQLILHLVSVELTNQ